MRLTCWLALLALSPCCIAAGPAAATITSSTPFTILWTAPGDDGFAGRATMYELRYSTIQFTAANYGVAAKLGGLPAPAPAGSPESFVVTGLLDSVSYYLAIKSVDEAGNWSAISNVFQRPASAPTLSVPMQALSFSSPYPNPARQLVSWNYSLPQAARVQVDVYDLAGRHVHTVEDDLRFAGAYALTWDLRDDGGSAVGAGVYFVRAQIGPVVWTKRLTVVR